jgi:hypothetical protein
LTTVPEPSLIGLLAAAFLLLFGFRHGALRHFKR